MREHRKAALLCGMLGCLCYGGWDWLILKPGGCLLLNDMDCIAPVRSAANWIFPRLPGGDVKMYSREEIEEMVRRAGFQKLRYRKISPFSFQCIAEKAR